MSEEAVSQYLGKLKSDELFVKSKLDLASLFRYATRLFSRETHYDLKKHLHFFKTNVVREGGKVFVSIRPSKNSGYKVGAEVYTVMDYIFGDIPEYKARIAAFLCFALRTEAIEDFDDAGNKIVRFHSKSLRQRILMLRASMLHSRSMIPIVITPLNGKNIPRIPDPSCAPPMIPDFIEITYKLYNEEYGGQALESFKKSRLTGTTIDGVCNSLQNLLKDTWHSPENPQELLKILRIVHDLKGWKPALKYPFPSWKRDDLINMPIPNERSSGIHLVKPYSETLDNGKQIYYAACAKKKNFKNLISMWVQEFVDKMHEKVLKGEKFDTSTVQSEINTIWAKVEALGPGKRKEKNRIFFIANLFSYMIAKFALRGLTNSGKRQGISKIGLTWCDGDMQRLYEECCDCIFYIIYDIKGYDTSHFATAVAFILGFYMFYYHHYKGESLYELIMCVFAYILNEATVRPLQWPDGIWRLVIGKILSGQFFTADFNYDRHSCLQVGFAFWIAKKFGHIVIEYKGKPTLVSEIIRMGIKAMLDAGRASSAEEANEILKKSPFRFINSGDNGIIAINCAELKQFFNLSNFRAYLASVGYGLNFEECHECTKWDSDIDLDTGELILQKWIDPDGREWEKPTGIEFLKMYSISVIGPKAKVHVPFKPTSNYYYRLGRTATPLENPLMTIIRAHGYMKTTYSNGWAFDFVKNWKNVFLKFWREQGIEYDVTNVDQWSSTLDIEYKRLMEDYEHRGHFIFGTVDLRYEPNFEKDFKRLIAMSESAVGTTTFYTEAAPTIRAVAMYGGYRV